MKKIFISLSFIFIALPSLASADVEDWYGVDYGYDTGSWSGTDYGYDTGSWSGVDYGYDTGNWYGVDYNYDQGNWSGVDYGYDTGNWYGVDYGYDTGNWYGVDYGYDTGSWYGVDYGYDTGSWYGGSTGGSNYYGNQDYYDVYQDYYPYDSGYDYGGNYGCGGSSCSGGYGYNYGYNYGNDYGYDYNYDYNYNKNNLSVVCVVSDRTLEEGDSATFTAEVYGGKSPYTYRWTGDVSGTGESVTKKFNDSGYYYATVKVTDKKGRTAYANCATVVVRTDNNDHNNNDLEAECRVSDTTIERGDRVTFTADVDGGTRPYRYDWSGDADSNDRSFSKTFNRTGRYEIDLKVTDDRGRVARDTCVVRVEDDNRNVITRSSTRRNNNDNNLASVSSVYLNQIPYTGPEDTAKGVAFAVGIIAWSIIGAVIIRKKLDKRSISKKVLAFKEAQRAAKTN